MSYIRDMSQVNQLEKLLGRRLTEWELEDDGEFEVKLKDGTYKMVQITRLRFPADLLSSPECYLVGGEEEKDEEDL